MDCAGYYFLVSKAMIIDGLTDFIIRETHKMRRLNIAHVKIM